MTAVDYSAKAFLRSTPRRKLMLRECSIQLSELQLHFSTRDRDQKQDEESCGYGGETFSARTDTLVFPCRHERTHLSPLHGQQTARGRLPLCLFSSGVQNGNLGPNSIRKLMVSFPFEPVDTLGETESLIERFDPVDVLPVLLSRCSRPCSSLTLDELWKQGGRRWLRWPGSRWGTRGFFM